MVTLEVRCCCRPTKLLGWVDVPDSVARVGYQLIGMRRSRRPSGSGRPWMEPVRAVPNRVERIAFPIEGYIVHGERPYPAVKSEERSVEDLQGLLAEFHFRPNNPLESTTMYFTISASGNRQQVLEALEKQRESSPDYASLKNQVIEHVAAHVQGIDGEPSSISVSFSGNISYAQPNTQASPSAESPSNPV